MDIKQIVLDLCALSDEQEWFEFKENWFQPEALGEYVSALSNDNKSLDEILEYHGFSG